MACPRSFRLSSLSADDQRRFDRRGYSPREDEACVLYRDLADPAWRRRDRHRQPQPGEAWLSAREHQGLSAGAKRPERRLRAVALPTTYRLACTRRKVAVLRAVHDGIARQCGWNRPGLSPPVMRAGPSAPFLPGQADVGARGACLPAAARYVVASPHHALGLHRDQPLCLSPAG